MEVYLIPVGRDRYQPYCETAHDAPLPVIDERPSGDEGSGGPVRRLVRPLGRWVRRVVDQFKAVLAHVERERHRKPGEVEPPRTWTARLQRRVMSWLAEAIAEQRLLWNLRKQPAATLWYPDDLDEPAAREALRANMRHELDRHRIWFVVDLILAGTTGVVFFFIPGPNLIAYYFVFRMVGHFLSIRGAKHGLNGVAWTYEPSEPLTELRGTLALEGEARQGHVAAVAARLRLEHLTSFFERTGLLSA